MNWQPREHIRLVFHAFKPFKQAEEDAVKALMDSLGDYDVEYAFLHVAGDHPYLLFDEAQKGVPSYDGTGLKGAAPRSEVGLLRLSGYEVLLTLTGAKEVKRPSDGMPRPVLLRLGPGLDVRRHDLSLPTGGHVRLPLVAQLSIRRPSRSRSCTPN